MTRLRSNSDTSYPEVHDSIFPADIRDSDLVRAEIELPNSEQSTYQARVWKLSPLGLEVLTDGSTGHKKGHAITFTLQLGNQRSSFGGTVVELSDHQATGMKLLGVRIHTKKESTARNENRRFAERWLCSNQFYPVAIAANPGQFNDFIYITVRDISAKGMRALTSLRNKFLVPGIQLEWQVSFPLTGHTTLSTKIARASLVGDGGKDYLELGLEFTHLDKQQKQTIGQYLVQFSDAESPAELRAEGFYPISLRRGIDYSFIKREDEFQEVLQLRLHANRKAEKIPEHYQPQSMADIYDSRSRIIVGRHKGKVVATARITIPDSDEQLEIESLHRIPPESPRKDQLVEVSRAATHPDFRGGSMWYSLIQQITVIAVQANRPYALISTTDELKEMYALLGFSDLMESYKNPLYPNKSQNVMLLDANEVLNGIGVNPAVWQEVWRPVLDHLQKYNVIATPKYRTRVFIYRIIGPIALAAYKLSRKKGGG